MVDFSGIRSFFTGSAQAAPASPAPAASAPPATSAPKPAATSDSYVSGGSDPGRALAQFSGASTRSYTDPGTAAGQKLAEWIAPHISEETKAKARELGQKVEDFRKRDDLPGHAAAQKGWEKIDEVSHKADAYLKEKFPALKRALEPAPQPAPIDGGEID